MKMVLNNVEVEVLSSQVVEDAIESELGELYSVRFTTDRKLVELGEIAYVGTGSLSIFSHMIVESEHGCMDKERVRLLIEHWLGNEVEVLVRIKFEG